MTLAEQLEIALLDEKRHHTLELLKAHFTACVALRTKRSPDDLTLLTLGEISQAANHQTDNFVKPLKAPWRPVSAGLLWGAAQR